MVASDKVMSCDPTMCFTFSLENQLQILDVVILSGSKLSSLIPKTMTSVLLGLKLAYLKATELVLFFDG